KPANVLLKQDGGQMHPMLTDFGIARLADSPGLTRTHEFVGTPAYVAPESAEGRPQTSAVDVYGAGILLYELVTGRPPFAGAYAPNGATSVLPNTSGPVGAADPTAVLPNRGAADPTAVMPPVPQHQPGAGPEEPHPWQNQLRAARDRNEQTQVQSYVDPDQ